MDEFIMVQILLALCHHNDPLLLLPISLLLSINRYICCDHNNGLCLLCLYLAFVLRADGTKGQNKVLILRRIKDLHISYM